MIRATADGVAAVLMGSWQVVRAHRRAYLVVWAAAIGAAAIAWPADSWMLARVQAAGTGTNHAAEWLSTIGRFENSSLMLAVGLAIVALVGGGQRWRDAAIACLLAGIIGGLAVVALRPMFGKTRPHAAAAPGLYWFELGTEFHSLPSGHATSNMASASAVLVVMPALGVPAVVVATAIGWSRMQLNQHYPVDVALGLLLGASIGLPVGAATVARRAPPRSTPRARS